MTEIGLLGAFLGGLLTLVSPCSALLLPSFFAYAFERTGTLVRRTIAFYAGLLVVLVPLGAGIAAVGAALTRHRGTVTTIGGGVLVLLGLVTLFGRGFGLASAQRATARIKISSDASVFALGTVYALAGFCSGPLIGSVLTVSAAGGNPVYGGVLMAVFALGMALPLFVLALLWDRYELGNRRWLRGREIALGPLRTHTTSLVSGLLFIAIGVLFLLTEGTANLGGLTGVDTQFAWQSRLQELAANVSTPVVLLALIGIALLILVVRRVRTGRRRQPESAEDGEVGDAEAGKEEAEGKAAGGDGAAEEETTAPE